MKAHNKHNEEYGRFKVVIGPRHSGNRRPKLHSLLYIKTQHLHIISWRHVSTYTRVSGFKIFRLKELATI